MATLVVPNSPNIQKLWLSRLGGGEEGDQLLEALNSSNITGVKYLNFCDNKSWWNNQNAAEILT